jgi:hypothetical protein
VSFFELFLMVSVFDLFLVFGDRRGLGGVITGVALAGLDGMMGGVGAVARGGVGVVGGRMSFAILVKSGGLAMMSRRQLMMVGGVAVVLGGGVLGGHVDSPWGPERPRPKDAPNP